MAVFLGVDFPSQLEDWLISLASCPLVPLQEAMSLPMEKLDHHLVFWQLILDELEVFSVSQWDITLW